MCKLVSKAPSIHQQPRQPLLDLFDRLQLQAVIGICRQSRTLSEAGRKLFNRSRTQRAIANDADRLRKYLQKFGLNWDAVVA